MSNYTFYIDPISIRQDTALVAIPTNNYEVTQSYDYLINVNINGALGLGAGVSLNKLFKNASYVWYPSNNTVGMNFTFDTLNVNTSLQHNIVNISQGTSSFPAGAFAGQEFPTVAESIAMKLKEVMAVKIFGSSGAVSAFTADTYNGFESNLPGLIANAVNNAFTGNRTEDVLFFDQYVASGRFTCDQENLAANNKTDFDPEWVPFNFAGSVIDIPLFFTGTVLDNGGHTINSSSYTTLSYPPASLIGGTNIPNNGIYNIPLLLKLHD